MNKRLIGLIAAPFWFAGLLLATSPPSDASPRDLRPAPFYSLPDDGVWAEYDWAAVGPEGHSLRGTLRLSSVGRQEMEGRPARWIEIRKQTPRQEGMNVHLRRLLVLEDSLAMGHSLVEAVSKVFDRDPEDGKIQLLTGPRLRQFLLMAWSKRRSIAE